MKKLVAAMLLASVLVAPFAIRAYAQDETPPEPPAQTEQSEEEEPEQETEETPPPEEPEEVTEENEEPVNEEEDPPALQDISLAAALAIAEAEHPDSEVVMAKVKMKKLDGEKVYKFVFADGWRIYIRASDGEIVRIKDASNKKHNCSHRGLRAVAHWRSEHKKRWGHHFRHHNLEHKKDWWEKHKQKQEQPAEPDEPAETEETEEEQ